MPKHVLYSAPFESRLETRERWRRLHMRPRNEVAAYVHCACSPGDGPRPVGLAGAEPGLVVVGYRGSALLALYCGGDGVFRLRRWRRYVSMVMYMEAIEDGLCTDRSIRRERCDRWYREHGSPWRLQPMPDSKRVHKGTEEWPMV